MSKELEFPAKYAKVLKDMPEFKDTADSASKEDLKKIIVMSEGNIYTIEKDKAADVKLQGAKSLLKDYNQPYNEAIKIQKIKVKYALFLLDKNGEDLDSQDEKE